MRRIALLWLVLTPLWISFSFSASTSKLAFIPPALVIAALALYWLHKQFVLLVAGEPEPRADARQSQSSPLDPVRGLVPGPSLVRPALAVIGVGACIGAAATTFFLLDRSLYESTGSDKSAAAPVAYSNTAISVPTKPVKAQSFSVQPEIPDSSHMTSSDNPDAKRAELQIQTHAQSSTDQPRCNVSLCERYYQSFRASDCTYQPHSGPRQYCAR